MLKKIYDKNIVTNNKNTKIKPKYYYQTVIFEGIKRSVIIKFYFINMLAIKVGQELKQMKHSAGHGLLS